MNTPQVLIAGGGPAGAVAALVLARRGISVTVLESRAAPERKVGECLPPSLTPLLQHLGLIDLLEQDGLERDGHLRSLGNRFVWGSPEPGERPFLTGTQGDGWHVDRQVFEARLAERAQAAGADWRWGCRLSRCERIGDRFRLEIESESGSEILETDFVGDATGRRARVARRLGARRIRYDRLVGIAALLRSPTPDPDTYTLIEAVPEGWWYSAILTDGRLAVAFMTDGDLLNRNAWNSGLARRLAQTRTTRARIEDHGYTLGEAPDEAPRVLPAETSRLDAILGDGWLALGDAAAAYDPLSSHGIGSAMGSGFYAGHAITDLLAGHEEAGLAYLDVLQNAYGGCLDLQRRHYAMERRWPEALFWKRRHAAAYGLEPV